MEITKTIFLALIQGLTEFLPVSSSGHLVVAQKFLGFQEPPVAYDIFLHLATLLAIVVYFCKQFSKILLQKDKILKLILVLAIGLVPTAFVGFLLEDQLKAIYNSFAWVTFGYLLGAILLISAPFPEKGKTKKISEINWKDGFWVGLFQMLAIIPGVSRSGATIVAGLWRSFGWETSFLFSFLLAIPTIVGVSIFQVKEIVSGYPFDQLLIGGGIAFITGLWALSFLKKRLSQKKLSYFGYYCFGMAILVMINLLR